VIGTVTYLTRAYLGDENAFLAGGIFGGPIIAGGCIPVYGMKMEKFLKLYFENFIMSPKIRKNRFQHSYNRELLLKQKQDRKKQIKIRKKERKNESIKGFK
jgi:hypothetical protein